MCEYCKNKKSIKETEFGSYYKIIGNEIEHHEECADSYYNYTERIPINFCPMCGRVLRIMDIKSTDQEAGLLASATIINPLIPEEPTEIQKAIKKAVEETITILNNTKLNNDFIKGENF